MVEKSCLLIVTLFIFFLTIGRSNTRSTTNCPDGTFASNEKCWMAGHAAGPMGFDRADAYCKSLGMEVPDLDTMEKALRSGDVRFFNPMMAYLAMPDAKINLSGDDQLMRRNVFYVRCFAAPASAVKLPAEEKRCPANSVQAKNLCWQVPAAPARNRPNLESFFPDAKKFCESRNARLPRREELEALSETGADHPNLNSFPDGDEIRYVLRGRTYWSSTEISGEESAYAVFIDFEKPAPAERRPKGQPAQTVCIVDR